MSIQSHIKEVEFRKGPYVYQLEIDTEDNDNLVIESVTAIDGPIKSDTDLDPDEFEDSLTGDDWQRLRELLER